MSTIGIIGGSGLYKIDGLKVKEAIKVDTPFGQPSSEFIRGELDGREVIFLPRHGKHHEIPPTKINYCANIYGMKKLGVDRIISVSACGSLKEEIKPLDFVIPLQLIDRTNQARQHTFFDRDVTVHVAFAHPFCDELSKVVADSLESNNLKVHLGGIYINMEGPQFSTLAESNLYRSWGADIIGMTNMAEARLAREAEICYATLAAVTDYDCWHESHDTVTVDVIIENLNKNVENAKKVLRSAIPAISKTRKCSCADALKHAIVTRPEAVSKEAKERLSLLIGKYIK